MADMKLDTPLRFDAPQVFAARMAVSATFLSFGLMFGIWFVHIPVVTARLALEPAILGLALLNVGLGAVVAPALGGIIVNRIGSRRACLAFSLASFTAILIPILAQNLVMLFAGTLIVGLCAGALNVAINTQAAEVETARGKPIMSQFHGLFSLGGFAAAGAGSALFALGWSDGRGAAGLVAMLILIGIWAGRNYLPDQPHAAMPAKPSGQRFVLPTAAILGLVVITFVTNMVEGSVGDWSALFLRTVKLSTPSASTLGYAMFALAMTVCRFGGGPVIARLGGKRVIVYGGVLIGGGMAIVVLSPWDMVCAIGFFVIGVGAANVSPVTISAASRTPGVSAAYGVAAVSTALAAGLLLGPPLIGFMAQYFGLTVALGALGVLGLLVAVTASLRTWSDTKIGTSGAGAA